MLTATTQAESKLTQTIYLTEVKRWTSLQIKYAELKHTMQQANQICQPGRAHISYHWIQWQYSM